jgi:hypothetical protein
MISEIRLRRRFEQHRFVVGFQPFNRGFDLRLAKPERFQCASLLFGIHHSVPHRQLRCLSLALMA